MCDRAYIISIMSRKHHKRGPRGESFQYVWNTCFSDRDLDETIATVNQRDIQHYLNQVFEDYYVGDVPSIEYGEVLLDNRRRGSVQLNLHQSNSNHHVGE